RTDRYQVCWSQSAADHDAFGGKLSGELDGLVSSLSQFLESPGDRRHKRLSEVACLRCVSLLHLIEQQFPSLIFCLGFSFLTLRQLKCLARIAQPLPSYRATNLAESTLRLVDIDLDAVKV